MGKLVVEALAISGMALIGLLAYVPLSSGSWPLLVSIKRSVTAEHTNMTTLIEQLASAKGIANDYVDAWGNPAQVTLESKAAMLAAMGYKVDDEVALQAQLEEEKHQHWQRPLDPVVVVRTGRASLLNCACPSGWSTTSSHGKWRPSKVKPSRVLWCQSMARWSVLLTLATPVSGLPRHPYP